MLRKIALVAPLLLAAPAARADVYNFKLSGYVSSSCGSEVDICPPSPVFDFDYDLSGGPTFFGPSSADFVIGNEDLTLFANGFALNEDVSGGLGETGTPYGGYYLIDNVYPIASGPWSNPTLNTGVFLDSVTNIYNTNLWVDSDTTLTITDVSAVPEPSTFLLALSGMTGGFAAFKQSRKRTLTNASSALTPER